MPNPKLMTHGAPHVGGPPEAQLVYLGATTPLQFQSKLPHASGNSRYVLDENPGFAPLSRSQQSPEYAA